MAYIVNIGKCNFEHSRQAQKQIPTAVPGMNRDSFNGLLMWFFGAQLFLQNVSS
jgi:hypothetical protein